MNWGEVKMWKIKLELIIRLVFWRIKIGLLPMERLDEEERKIKRWLQWKNFEKFICKM